MNRGDDASGGGTLVMMSLSMLIAMSLCCGGPFLLLAGAAIGPAILSAIGVPTIAAAIGGLAVTVGVILRRRRACADCALPPIKPETELSKAGVDRLGL